MKVRVREMTAEESEAIKRLAHSRTEAASEVERARIIWLSKQGKVVPDIAEQLGICQATARLWLKHFNARGLAGLNEEPRSGRPDTYTPEQAGEEIASALTNPRSLGLRFACWTLDRLEANLNEIKDIPIKRSRIDDLLINEGLRWRKQETWFGERVDPAFAEKRGSSRSFTRSRRKIA